MRFGSDTWSGDEDADDTCSVDYYLDLHAIHVKPSHMQRVAITGSWCQVLPKACEALWRHRGCHVCGMTIGDDMAVDELAEPFEQPAEIAGQSDWNLKRQQAKRREKVKRVRAAGRQSKSSMSRSPQASYAYQDVVLNL